MDELKVDKKKKRILWLDILRGIAMFLVIYGHTTQNVQIQKYIYSFHMPLFFIISGMAEIFQKTEGTKEFVKKKIKTLVIPYFLLNLLMFPITYINDRIRATSRFSIKEYLIGTIYSNTMNSYSASSNATWFILTLFLTELLFFFMKKITKNDKELFYLTSILALAGYANSISKWKYHGPWHIQVVFTAVAFYYIGYIFMKNIDSIKELFNKKINTLIYVVVLFVIGMYFAYNNTRVSLTADKYGSFLYFYIAALSLSFALILFTMKFLDRNLRITKYIGQNCILWVAIQIPIIRYIQKTVPIVKEVEMYALALAFIVFLEIMPFAIFINKFLPFLCGKDYNKNKCTNTNIYIYIYISNFCYYNNDLLSL